MVYFILGTVTAWNLLKFCLIFSKSLIQVKIKKLINWNRLFPKPILYHITNYLVDWYILSFHIELKYTQSFLNMEGKRVDEIVCLLTIWVWCFTHRLEFNKILERDFENPIFSIIKYIQFALFSTYSQTNKAISYKKNNKENIDMKNPLSKWIFRNTIDWTEHQMIEGLFVFWGLSPSQNQLQGTFTTLKNRDL